MRIAVNTRFLLPSKMEGFGWYTYEIVKRLVEEHPEHDFIFFFDRAYDERFIFGSNVTPVVLRPQARHPILFNVWYNFSITRALKKYKADLFFSPDGYLSLRTDIKQVNVIHDINFEHNPQDVPPVVTKYLRRNFPKFARKADHILTVSEYSKKDICETYSISPDKITAVWNGASELFTPISEVEKKAVRQQFANGNPYLLFVGAIHPRKNLKRLLTAFEQYTSSHPESSYQLVIVGESLFNSKRLTISAPESVSSRIHFTGHVELKDLAQIMGGASIFTFVPYFEGFGIPLVEAMKCGTPILAGNLTSLPEVAGDAALYCDPLNTADIREKLTQLCEDKALREGLSQKGLQRSTLFSWDKSANEVWNVLSSIINPN